MTNTVDYVEIARRVIQERVAKGGQSGTAAGVEAAPVPLEAVLEGHAVELWSTSEDQLFLVANEDDARVAMERFSARRGQIYTAAEARRIIAVGDPQVVAEMHHWKLEFDGVVRDDR